MEEDDPSSILAHKAHLLETLIPPLSSSTSKLCSRSRTIPSNKDFHFYNNFPEFKRPNKEIQSKLQSSLESLSSSSNIFDSKKQPPLPSDLDDSYDWLVNLNDEFVERFNISLDEFRRLREKEEGKDGNLKLEEGGFQLVRNKKKKGSSMDEAGKDEGLGSSSGVKIGLKYKKAVAVKSKVPFHIPTIRRPQDEFNILVNNVNQPFEHVWLERSEDGKRVIHPLEKMSVLDFIDRSIGDVEIAKPLPLESTPFKLVEGVKDLKELAAKLQDVKEFAVDLEHNQYRSFQGLTCLMQISTRTEDFIIDTLKLRVHIGPYLREVFKDPSKRKVMHGADRDIEWLQRDFGIYVCNLFDTGQASRVLQLERNSLEYLLHHFCGVSANKEYQAADWRLRPIPDEMLKYGREDTHYLLHIYDLMKLRLLSASPDDDLLLEVYKRSYDICIHLYQKELLTDTSFLYIYGLQEADFNSKQLSIASELYAWRDQVAREEDESTGYILPNKILLEIAREMPVSSGKLRRLVKSKHSLVERHLNTVINLIRGAIENSSEFDSIAEELRNARLESTRQKLAEASTDVEMVAGTEDPIDSTISERDALDVTGNSENLEASENAMDVNVKPANAENLGGIFYGKQQEKEKTQPMSMPETGCAFKISDTDGTIEKEKMDYVNTDLLQSNKKGSISSVQILKKTSGFGSLLGNSASRRKLNPGLGGVLEQDKNMNKVEQIKSSVVLPFHSFAGSGNISEPNPSEGIIQTQPETRQQHPIEPSATAQLEEVIRLNNDDSDDSSESPCANDGFKCRERSPRQENGSGEASHLETEAGEEPISLSDLSSSFQQCFQSINQDRSSYKKNGKQSQENEVKVQVKPFDYAAARKIINFTGVREHDGDGGHDSNPLDSGEKRRASAAGRSNNGEGRERGLRRQAFPPSGNRSTTYK